MSGVEAFDAWWPHHAVRHNSRSPVAARDAFNAGWDAAAPLIDAAARASERETIRQLAIDRDATWQPTAICNRDCSRAPHPYPSGPPLPFADLLATGSGAPGSRQERPQSDEDAPGGTPVRPADSDAADVRQASGKNEGDPSC